MRNGTAVRTDIGPGAQETTNTVTAKVIHTQLRGHTLLRNPLLYKGTAFTDAERDLLGLHGLLPSAHNSQDQQAVRFYQRLSAVTDPLTRYRELASLQDRNEHLYFRILMDHLAELMPIVYTPTVGLACQKFSEVFQRGRGVWITPADRGRVKQMLECAADGRQIRLSVVTDNESILGIGDQGAGGMAISIGKLALYTAAAGIDPVQTLPVSLDVGTNNRDLLQNDLYLGWPRERLSGPAYDELVEEFVVAFSELFPDALIQWEDFRKDNALVIADRYRERFLSFNDDIQGTGAVTLAGVFSAMRKLGEGVSDQRIVIHGAGAAGLGIARQIKAALRIEGVREADMHAHVALLDSSGLLVADRSFADAYKAELAWPHAAAIAADLDVDRSLEAVVRQFAPTVLIGTSGQPGAFHESLVRQMATTSHAPIIFPLSNPNANCEANPEDLIRWTDGRALVATGSPFPPVTYAGRTTHIGQGNNVFVFPAIGLGALLAGARSITDTMISRTASSLAEQVRADDLARGLLYPDISRLREITALGAAAVCEQAHLEGLATREPPADFVAAARAAMWTPDYPTFI
jgi:malate dehydrogenase (oxaloacetate-decarboxylating)